MSKRSDDGQILKQNKMPLNLILEIEIFNVWGINLIGPSRV